MVGSFAAGLGPETGDGLHCFGSCSGGTGSNRSVKQYNGPSSAIGPSNFRSAMKSKVNHVAKVTWCWGRKEEF